ncbi:MAG: tetratricopeptide repeat protein, partial [Rhodocyclaceae bacterium]|nr:tetratricopeptide repeat protein [Rhodocyclaceae bacterium]
MMTMQAEALLLQGVEAAGKGELVEAARYWWQLIELSPSPPLLTQAWFNLGVLCNKSQNTRNAIACFENALRADEANHEAREQLALVLAEQGDIGNVSDASDASDAIGHLQRLVTDAPEARHHFNLALLLSRERAFDQAELHYQLALTLQPDHADALSNLGLLLAERGMTNEAIDCLKRAAASAPDNATVCVNLGGLLESTNQLDIAALLLQRAIDLEPEDALHHSNLAVVRVEQRDLAAAEAGFRQALALAPDFHGAAVYLAQLLLACGRYAEGWPLHEARFPLAAATGKPVLAVSDAPRWQGESLHGKTLLLLPEQGYGDEIMFSRYVSRLREMGAARIILLARPQLLPVLRSLAGVEVLSLSEAAPLPAHDYWLTSMSVPMYCDPSSIPAKLPYLQAPVDAVQTWAERLGPVTDKLRVGLLWQGNHLHANDAQRSLTDISVLAPMWAVEGVSFFSLQREKVET